MMGSFGRGLGASMRGYNDGRDQLMKRKTSERDFEEHEEDRKRQKRIEGQYDPINLEQALLTIQQARRTGELNEYIHKQRYGFKAADRGDEVSELNLSASRRGEEIGVLKHPGDKLAVSYRDTQAQQNNELGVAAHKGNMEQIGYRDTAARNANELGNLQHPNNVTQERFLGTQMDDAVTDYGADRKFWDSYENVNRSLANFSMTGDPKILMDAYDMYIDDGVDALIEKLPGVDGKGPRYRVSVNNGNPPQEFESKEALLAATEKVFMNHLQRTQPQQGRMGMGGYGSGYYGSGGGRGGRGGRGGYGGVPGRTGRYGMQQPPADIQTAEYLKEAMKGLDEYAGKSDSELTMAAWDIANATGGMTPEDDIRKFLLDTFKELIQPDPMGGRRMTPTEAFREASRAAQQYAFTAHQIGEEPPMENEDMETWMDSAIGHPR